MTEGLNIRISDKAFLQMFSHFHLKTNKKVYIIIYKEYNIRKIPDRGLTFE